MDARDLKVFEAVARHAGMNRAAMELNTVQSNVTTRIKLLERELGTTLFERHTRGMKLTPAGARLLPHVSEVRIALENARRAVLNDGTPRGPLSVGSRRSTAAQHMTGLVTSYVAAYPAVDISLYIETSSVLLGMVLERKLEGAFVAGQIEHPELVGEVVFNEELAVMTGADVTQLTDLRPERTRMIVLGKGSFYHLRLAATLTRLGLSGFRLLELPTPEGIMGCISAGLGVTLLPRSMAASLVREGKVRVHDALDQDRRLETLFVRRRDGFVSSALSAFLDTAHRYAAGPASTGARPGVVWPARTTQSGRR
jgi:DNA-binding transcriptional LysR family regulator